MKKILFLSALDFKKKSIQVIRKTPEEYVKKGWQVDYIVARDSCPTGNYYYEEIINPKNINVSRFFWPFPSLRAKLPRHLALLLSKLTAFYVIFKLFFKAYKKNRHEKYDVIYGYELQGVLAMHLLRPFLKKHQKKISRFQGTFLHEMFKKRQVVRLIFNIDLIIAIWLKADLIIMTDDGTQGDKAVKKIKGDTEYHLLFLTNGVDKVSSTLLNEAESRKISNEVNFITVSRLVSWKRVDRCIEIFSKVKENSIDFKCKLTVVGEGSVRQDLEALVKQKGLTEDVVFLGAINHEEVARELINSDIFLSMYESSNVGNPLLEAIRANLLIVTLNNGDTGSWITHHLNGLIYEEHNLNNELISTDIIHCILNENIMNNMKERLKDIESTKLFTWDERLSKEENIVRGIVSQI